MFCHWEETPPVHISIAGLVAGLSGGGRGRTEKARVPTEDELKGVIASLG